MIRLFHLPNIFLTIAGKVKQYQLINDSGGLLRGFPGLVQTARITRHPQGLNGTLTVPAAIRRCPTTPLAAGTLLVRAGDADFRQERHLHMIPVEKHVRGLIFDCDGTLADTMPIHMEAWCDTFHAYGFECPKIFLNEVKGMPAVKIVEEFNRRFRQDIGAEAFAREKNERARNGLHLAEPLQPVLDIVNRFKGRLPMAVASGGIRANVLLIIEAIGLKGVFDAVITADDAVEPKPSPAIFLEAARRIHVESRFCQVFEDGDMGLQAARRAGMAATDVRKYI